ncbi:MAG TPA: hypothetical protein VMS17_12610 [Gemmataceae bacterium]|nr:hypothetical protein [Gemmataceae bacterium]
MTQDRFHKLMTFLQKLEEAKIYHELAHHRYDAVSVYVTVPGERWEVDFLEDGTVDVERFRSNGHIDDESALTDLFANFSDEEVESKDAAKPIAGQGIPGTPTDKEVPASHDATALVREVRRNIVRDPSRGSDHP